MPSISSQKATANRWRNKRSPSGNSPPTVEELFVMLQPLYADGIIEDNDEGSVILTERGWDLCRQNGFKWPDDGGDFIAFLMGLRDEKIEVYQRITKGAT